MTEEKTEPAGESVERNTSVRVKFKAEGCLVMAGGGAVAEAFGPEGQEWAARIASALQAQEQRAEVLAGISAVMGGFDSEFAESQ